jgi:uncharacterized membrane protein YheB (UPF0754 family)
MLLTDDLLRRWEEVVASVDKDHVPIECVKKVVFRFAGGRQKTINLRRLRGSGADSEQISDILDRFVQAHATEINNMEFVLDIEAVAELLQPEIDKLLKGI